MKGKAALIFIDGTICDDRHQLEMRGTQAFYSAANVMNEQPVPGSLAFVDELAKKYNIIYLGARPQGLLETTRKWLSENGFPHGKLFLSSEQSERIHIAESVLVNENVILGVGDRWDDNQLHLILGCKSVIVKEYSGDFVKDHVLT